MTVDISTQIFSIAFPHLHTGRVFRNRGDEGVMSVRYMTPNVGTSNDGMYRRCDLQEKLLLPYH